MTERNALEASKTGVQKLYSEEKVLGYILLQKAAGRSLRQIANNDFGGCVTYGDVQRAMHGVFPKRPQKRLAMGLTPMRPAPACPNCGDVHTKKTCPAQHKPCPPRLAIRLDDPHSAARSIRRHMTTDQIAALVRALEE